MYTIKININDKVKLFQARLYFGVFKTLNWLNCFQELKAQTPKMYSSLKCHFIVMRIYIYIYIYIYMHIYINAYIQT